MDGVGEITEGSEDTPGRLSKSKSVTSSSASDVPWSAAHAACAPGCWIRKDFRCRSLETNHSRPLSSQLFCLYAALSEWALFVGPASLDGEAVGPDGMDESCSSSMLGVGGS